MHTGFRRINIMWVGFTAAVMIPGRSLDYTLGDGLVAVGEVHQALVGGARMNCGACVRQKNPMDTAFHPALVLGEADVPPRKEECMVDRAQMGGLHSKSPVGEDHQVGEYVAVAGEVCYGHKARFPVLQLG
jgi:hypothetical protein